MTNLDQIETTGQARQALAVMKEELKVQREVFVRPTKREAERAQHTIESLRDGLVGEVTIELPLCTVTVSEPEEHEHAMRILKTYRDRMLHHLGAYEEQYDRQRDRMMRLFKAIEKSEAAAAAEQQTPQVAEAAVDGGGN